MKIAVLGSGSSGNSIYIESHNFGFLIDVGFSGKKMEEKLKGISVNISKIKAILITHEHTDHTLGAGIFSRKYNIPLYITKESYEKSKTKLGKIRHENLIFMEKNFYLSENIYVEVFDVMHDADRTVGFVIKNSDKKKFAIATDIGYTTNMVKEKFKNSDVIIIEANYDYDMLMSGSYPWELKNRVKSKNGHLSNEEAANFINEVYSENLKKIYLAHISEDNNDYDIAYNTVKKILKKNKINIELEVLKKDNISKIFKV